MGGLFGASSGSKRAAQAAMFEPTQLNFGPFGGVQGRVNYLGGGRSYVDYNTDPGLFGEFIPGLTGLATSQIQQLPSLAASGGVTPFMANEFQIGAGGLDRLLSQLPTGQPTAPNLDLDAATQQELQRLNALAAPGEQTATTRLFDQLYGSGRLGVNMSGELGPIGGLDLSQRLAGLERLGLARSSAYQNRDFLQRAYESQAGIGLQGQQLGLSNILGRFGLAGQALGLGRENLAQQLQLGLSGIGGLTGIQDIIRQGLETSIAASQARSAGNAAAGGIRGRSEEGRMGFFGDILGAALGGILGG